MANWRLDMIDIRLVKEVDNSLKFVLLNVLIQWVSLLSNILIIFKITEMINDILITKQHTFVFVDNIIYLGLLILIRFICAILAARFSYLASDKVKLDLRSKIYAKLLLLGPAYSEKISTSEVLQVAVEGVDQLEIYFGRYLPQLFYSLLAPITLFIVISFINFKTALVLFICVPLIPISIVLVQKFAKKLLNKYWSQYTTLGDSFLENIEGLTTLKIYEADEAKNIEMNIEAEHFRIVTMKVLFMQLNSISIMDVIAFGGAGLGIIVASTQFLLGNLSFSYALAIILLSSEFFIPLRLLGSYFHIAMNGMAASDKIFSLLDLEEISYGEDYILEQLKSISLENLTFGYNLDKDVLKNLNIKFNVGLNAVVGVSGSGKSSIAKLLSLRNTNYEGIIKLNENSLTKFCFKSVSENIMSVDHDAFLFKGSVRENLLMGDKNANDDQLINVLTRVNLIDFLNSQNGLDTLITSNGTNLSGGQRQRLALARALLSDAQVYIFDEATSNIDAESEAAIMKVIVELSKEKIVIVISHRLFNTITADNIYVIEDGEVKESGKHAQLMLQKSLYHELYSLQSVYESYVGGSINE